MATPSNKDLTPKKSPSRRNRKIAWFLVAVSVLVLSVFAYKEFSKYQNEKAAAVERARFVQADKDVQKITDAITSVLNEPIQASADRYCGRRSTKYEQAPLVCRTIITAFYITPDIQTANSLVGKVERTVDDYWRVEALTASSNLNGSRTFREFDKESYDPLTGFQSLSGKYKNELADMECGLSSILYKSNSPPFSSYLMNELSPYTLAISVSCSDKSKVEAYTVRY